MLGVINNVNGGVVGSNDTDDNLQGGAEDNVFFVGRGTDFVDGGAGTDVLNVDGEAIEWTFTTLPNGQILMTHPTWGANTLENIESIFFARSGNTLSIQDAINATAGLPAQRLDSDNVINGTDGDDTLTAVDGVQGLYGGVGNDSFNADAGIFAQVNYDGNRSEFTIVENGDGSITVFHPIWGTDTLSNIDGLAFTGREPGVDGAEVGPFEFIAIGDIDFDDALPAPAPVVPAPVDPEPVVDTPVVDAPVADEPIVDAPVVDAPVTDAPVVDAPIADAPVATAGDDNIFGTAGDDILIGGLGSDTLNGGAGNDILTGDEANGNNGNRDQDIFEFGDVFDAPNGNDVITDFDTNNFDGGENNFDTLSLTIADEAFNISTGSDLISFAAALENDGDVETNAFSDGDDVVLVFETDQNEIIQDSIRLEDVIGDDGINGSADQHFVVVGAGDALIFADTDPAPIDAPIEVSGDILSGTSGDDFIDAGNGDDIIKDSAGNDFTIGGSGADIFSLGNIANGAISHDVIADFQSGKDLIDVSNLDGVDSIEDLFITTNNNGHVAIFISETNSVTFNNLTNPAELSASDFIFDATNAPAPEVAPEPAPEPEPAGNIIKGTDGNDDLIGTAEDDIILSSAGDDLLYGGAGNDTLETGGLGGNDFLIGAEGADSFVFSDVVDGASSHDVIADFQNGKDVLDVSDLSGVSSFDDLFITTNDNGHVAIFLSEDQSVTFNNLTEVDALTADDFIF